MPLLASVLKFLSIADHLRVCSVSKELQTIAKSATSWEVIKIEPLKPQKFWRSHPNAMQRLAHTRPRVLSVQTQWAVYESLPQASRAAFQRMLPFVERLDTLNACLRYIRPLSLPLLTHLKLGWSSESSWGMSDADLKWFALFVSTLKSCERLQQVEITHSFPIESFVKHPSWSTFMTLPIVGLELELQYQSKFDLSVLAGLPLTSLAAPFQESPCPFAKLFPRLTRFNAKPSHVKLADKTIAALRGLQLRSLAIFGDISKETADIIGAFPLRELHFSGLDGKGEIAKRIFSSLPLLEVLHIETYDPEPLVASIKQLPQIHNLRELSLQGPASSAFDALLLMRSLIRLKLDHAEITDEQLIQLAKTLTNLQVLHIEPAHASRRDGPYQEQLQRVSAIVEPLSRLPRLTQLHCELLPGFTDQLDELQYLCTSMPREYARPSLVLYSNLTQIDFNSDEELECESEAELEAEDYM